MTNPKCDPDLADTTTTLTAERAAHAALYGSVRSLATDLAEIATEVSMSHGLDHGRVYSAIMSVVHRLRHEANTHAPMISSSAAAPVPDAATGTGADRMNAAELALSEARAEGERLTKEKDHGGSGSMCRGCEDEPVLMPGDLCTGCAFKLKQEADRQRDGWRECAANAAAGNDSLRVDLSASRAREEALREALAFAASVIKSGEAWTGTCDDIIGAALAGSSAPLAALRPEVLAFARVMNAKIEGHNHDRGEHGWRTATPARLLEWLNGYVTALSYALDASTMDAVLGKAANVANLAMMIADVCGALAPAPGARSPDDGGAK